MGLLAGHIGETHKKDVDNLPAIATALGGMLLVAPQSTALQAT